MFAKLISNVLTKAKDKAKSLRAKEDLDQIYCKYSNYTMIPKAIYVNNLLLASTMHAIEGSIVECGTWKGGMIAGFAEILGQGRSYHLYDSFDGLPDAEEIDGLAALDWQRNADSDDYHNNCTASELDAQRAMSLSPSTSFIIHKGWFKDTLLPGNLHTDTIAILRLDCDWYNSTMICLETLFPKLTSGGLIIIDDYYTWDGCSRAVHDFMSRFSLREKIETSFGICVIKKL